MAALSGRPGGGRGCRLRARGRVDGAPETLTPPADVPRTPSVNGSTTGLAPPTLDGSAATHRKGFLKKFLGPKFLGPKFDPYDMAFPAADSRLLAHCDLGASAER